MTDEAVILERGQVVHRAQSKDLLADQATLDRLEHVAGEKPRHGLERAMSFLGVIDDVTRQRLLQCAREMPERVGAVAGAHERDRNGVGASKQRAGRARCLGDGLDLCDTFGLGQQRFEHRCQRQIVHQVAAMLDRIRQVGFKLGGLGIGDRQLGASIVGQRGRHTLGTVGRPVRVGFQIHLGCGFALLHGAQQVRHQHARTA